MADKLSPEDLQHIRDLLEQSIQYLRDQVEKTFATESHEEIKEKGFATSIFAEGDTADDGCFIVFSKGAQSRQVCSWFLAHVGRQPVSKKIQ